MKKLFVDKTESIASVVERVIGDADSEVVLVIPRDSVLKESGANFKLLKREADAAGKKISVESVDEEVLVMAKTSKIDGGHPLLNTDARPQPLLDIMPRQKPTRPKVAPALQENSSKEVLPPRTAELPKKEESTLPPPPKIIASATPLSEAPRPQAPPLRPSPTIRVVTEEKTAPRFEKSRGLRLLLWIGIPVLLILLGGVVFGSYFARADIVISFKKNPWLYENSFSGETSATKVDAEKRILPIALFTQEKNTTQLFSASDSREVSLKATGNITIYNGYSSAAQTLVATTRFTLPDGKIFRLVEQVVVPGAEIEGGKILPASIEASVVADKAGPEYNVGPLARLEIPGFRGTPRYEKFYGELKEGTSGGFIGKKPVPTVADIDAAKKKTTEILETGLESAFAISRPEDFTVLDGAKEKKVIKLTVNENTDARGNFSVFGEATLRVLGFREADLKGMLDEEALGEQPNTIFEEVKLEFEGVVPDFAKGKLSFSVKANSTRRPRFNEDAFRAEITGKDADEVRSRLLSIPGLASAKISIWPLWAGAIPGDQNRVKITIQ